MSSVNHVRMSVNLDETSLSQGRKSRRDARPIQGYEVARMASLQRSFRGLTSDHRGGNEGRADGGRGGIKPAGRSMAGRAGRVDQANLVTPGMATGRWGRLPRRRWRGRAIPENSWPCSPGDHLAGVGRHPAHQGEQGAAEAACSALLIGLPARRAANISLCSDWYMSSGGAPSLRRGNATCSRRKSTGRRRRPGRPPPGRSPWSGWPRCWPSDGTGDSPERRRDIRRRSRSGRRCCRTSARSGPAGRRRPSSEAAGRRSSPRPSCRARARPARRCGRRSARGSSTSCATGIPSPTCIDCGAGGAAESGSHTPCEL